MHSYLFALVGTLIALWFLMPFSRQIGLVDRPDGRKQHKGDIPLIGGVAMFIGFMLSALTLSNPPEDLHSFLFASVILIGIGVLDDYQGTDVRMRFFAQVIAALIMGATANHQISNLDNLFNEGDILLGNWALPFTVFSVVGVINALNMSDGIDGLASGVSLISFGAMLVLAFEAGRPEASMILLFMCVILPFFLLNAPFLGKSRGILFMGDAGSMFLGFALAWYFTVLCQGEHAVMSPITALWIFAIPLLDTVSIMVRRMLKGRSPFSPDRDHFHHVFLAAGFSTRKTLVIILVVQIVLAAIGIAGYKVGVPDWIMFWSYIGLLGLFFWALKRATHVKRILQKFGGGAA